MNPGNWLLTFLRNRNVNNQSIECIGTIVFYLLGSMNGIHCLTNILTNHWHSQDSIDAQDPSFPKNDAATRHGALEFALHVRALDECQAIIIIITCTLRILNILVVGWAELCVIHSLFNINIICLYNFSNILIFLMIRIVLYFRNIPPILIIFKSCGLWEYVIMCIVLIWSEFVFSWNTLWI